MERAEIRRLHRTLEPYHGMIYFVPEGPAAYAEVGIRGRMGYFASRGAALGPVSAETVIATFYNFHSDLVRRAIPAAWAIASPEQLLAARLRAVDAALRRVLGDGVASKELAEAAELAAVAAGGGTLPGHPLYAAHAALDPPKEPHLALWWAQTLLREFRGDGHIAALTTQGLSGVEALVVHDATGAVPAGVLQGTRAWPDDEWAAGVAAVRARGWLDDAGALTPAGLAARQWVEDTTDDLTAGCWERLDADARARLRELAQPFATALLAELPGGGRWMRTR